MTRTTKPDDQLSEVLHLVVALADRVLDMQIRANPVPPEQIAALMRAAHVLHTHGVEWPPLLSMVVRDLAENAWTSFYSDDLEHRLPSQAELLPIYSDNLALHKPATQSSLGQWLKHSLSQDAAGGVNGVISGLCGFHTDIEESPWWQVDLLATYYLCEVRIYNRNDDFSSRARTLQVLISQDCEAWSKVHDQAGATFGGLDCRPLRVMLDDVAARYVRLQLAERNYLHLDEVQVFSRMQNKVSIIGGTYTNPC